MTSICPSRLPLLRYLGLLIPFYLAFYENYLWFEIWKSLWSVYKYVCPCIPIPANGHSHREMYPSPLSSLFPLSAYGLEFQFVVVAHAGVMAGTQPQGVSVGETVGEQSYFFDDAQRIFGVICFTWVNKFMPISSQTSIQPSTALSGSRLTC